MNNNQSEKQNKFSKKRIILAIVTVLAIALAVTGFAGCGEKSENVSEVKLGDLSAEEITNIEFYPTSEVTAAELKDAADVMDKRLGVLGNAYEISADDEKITLKIGKAMLGESALERTSTLELIQGRSNFTVGTYYGYSLTETDKKVFKNAKVVALDTSEFISDYEKYFDSDFEDVITGITSDKIYVVSVDLSSEAEQDIEAWREYDEGQIYALHSVETYSGYGDVLGGLFEVKTGDYSTCYIVSNGCSYEKNAELIKYNLEKDSFDMGFVTKIVDEPTWETKSSDFGAKQVASMSGETIVVEAIPDDYTVLRNSASNFEAQKENIKARLDTLGIEYMFGTKGFDDKTYCIRMSPQHIAPDLVRMIFNGKNIEVFSAFDDVSSFITYEMNLDETGNLGLVMESYNSAEEIKTQYNIPNDIVYLVVNDVTVAQANINDMVEKEGKYFLEFENFLCFDYPEATSTDKKILEMICAIANEDYTYHYVCEYNIRLFRGEKEVENFDLSTDIAWKHSSISAADEAMFTAINSMGYDVSKKIDALNMIEIVIDDVSVDENLVSEFVKKVKTIYDECYFDGGAYRKIIFVIENEKTQSPANEFRITVEKDDFENKMIAGFDASGPAFSDYWSEAYNYELSDEFFTLRN